MLGKVLRGCVGAGVIYAAERGAEVMWPEESPWTWWSAAAVLAVVWLAVEVWWHRRSRKRFAPPNPESDGISPWLT